VANAARKEQSSRKSSADEASAAGKRPRVAPSTAAARHKASPRQVAARRAFLKNAGHDVEITEEQLEEFRERWGL